jgi:hypothetical protein
MRDTPCAARGAEPLAFLLVLGGGALRGGRTSLLRWVAENRRVGDREAIPPFTAERLPNAGKSQQLPKTLLDE